MEKVNADIIITQTKKWIIDIVVGCNFCPFASREVKRGSIYYEVLHGATLKTVLETTIKMFQQLDDDKNIETSLLILPNNFETFTAYLDMVEKVEKLLEKEGYEGVYQIASFHPRYLFAGSTENDPSNYTNRSPYAMLHFLREESVSRAVDAHPNIDDVPEQNIAFAQEKGLGYMQALFAACMA
jgi:uncharacterized protein